MGNPQPSRPEMAGRFNDYRCYLDYPFTLATVIGDGCLGIPKDRPNSCYLSFTHSAAQRDYLAYKVSKVNKELGTRAGVSPARPVYDPRTGKTYESCQSMVTSPVLKSIRRLVYPSGKKELTGELLKLLGLEALAVYWMDDGCVVRSKFSQNVGYLASYCSLGEAELQCEWIAGLTGIAPSPYRDRGHYRIRIKRTDMPKFVSAIRPYVHSSMASKVTLVYSDYKTKSKAEYEASLTIPFVDEGDKAARARSTRNHE